MLKKSNINKINKINKDNKNKDNDNDNEYNKLKTNKTKNTKDQKEYQSVTLLNAEIKQILDSQYDSIKVSGELTNYKISGNNMYATLKDADSAINIIVWGFINNRNGNALFDVCNGDNVTVYGKIVLYQKAGSYSITASKIEKNGIGSLYQDYELKKKYYENLGYYDNKKKFPNVINKIGIITAKDGAALQDILHVLGKNGFYGKIFIKNCLVQGNNSSSSIAQAINTLSSNDYSLDLLIITRGGGSFEDLISFSSDEVIEAIHNSNIFTISAVGHEIDFMLSDFVADLRAATPSVAAEIVATAQRQKINEYIKYKNYVDKTVIPSFENQIFTLNLSLNKLVNSLSSNSPTTKIQQTQELLKLHRTNMEKILDTSVIKIKERIKLVTQKIQKYDIENMLQSGYTVLIKNNRIIDSINDIKTGQKLKLKMKDGDVTIIVENIDNKNDTIEDNRN